jgi:hypothetical protein
MAFGLRTTAATKLFSSKPSFARHNQTIKAEINMECMRLFLLADSTMLKQEHNILRKQFSRFVSADYYFLCFAKCGKKYEGPLNNLLSLDCSQE